MTLGFVPVYRAYSGQGHLYPAAWRIRCSDHHGRTWNYTDTRCGDLSFRSQVACVAAIDTLARHGIRCDRDFRDVTDLEINALLLRCSDWGD